MKVVLRREDGAERQIVEIGEIDLMARLYVAQQLRRKHEAKEDVDRQQKHKVRNVIAKVWAPPTPSGEVRIVISFYNNFEMAVPLAEGYGSDVQLFGCPKGGTDLWRISRQELYLDDDLIPFAVIHWRHSVERIILIDILPGAGGSLKRVQ